MKKKTMRNYGMVLTLVLVVVFLLICGDFNLSKDSNNKAYTAMLNNRGYVSDHYGIITKVSLEENVTNDENKTNPTSKKSSSKQDKKTSIIDKIGNFFKNIF